MKYDYEIRNAAGKCCCGSDDPNFPRCPKCKGKPVTQRRSMRRRPADHPAIYIDPTDDAALELRTLDDTDFSPPDPYEAQLTAIRKANETPMSRFEEQYIADWRAELERERANPLPPPPPRPPFTTDCTPPDPYAAGLAELAKLRST